MSHCLSGFGLECCVRFDGLETIPAEQVWLLDRLFTQIDSVMDQEPFQGSQCERAVNLFGATR